VVLAAATPPRLAIENVNAQNAVAPATTGIINVSLVTGYGQDKFLPVGFGVRIASAQDRYWVNASVLQYVAAGATVIRSTPTLVCLAL